LKIEILEEDYSSKWASLLFAIPMSIGRINILIKFWELK
jgi:hypothetical protein